MKELEEGAKRSTKVVNGVEVPILMKEIVDANSFFVEVGTTGFKGGDTGHGGRTFFLLHNAASTDIEIVSFSDRLAISLGGDSELRTFIEALEFAADTLRKQAEYGDTKADIMTQLQKASKTVLELSAKNKELIKDVDAMKEEVKASTAKTEEYHRLMLEMGNVAVVAQNFSKRDIEEIKELKKELNDDVAKMDRLRAKEMAWRIAFFLFAGISAVELLYMYCNRLF